MSINCINIEDYKVVDYYEDNYRIMRKFIELVPEERNINILDGELYKGAKNQYTIDLTKFWFCDDVKYDPKERKKTREYELRRSVYDKITTEYYTDKRECLDVMFIYESRTLELADYIVKDASKYYCIHEEFSQYDEKAENLIVTNKDLDLDTNWGDGTIDNEKEHLYLYTDLDVDEDNFVYHLETTGFIDTVKYTHTGKNVVSIDKFRLNIANGSWLFAEHYYAETGEFFPVINTKKMDTMSHMYYHCPRLLCLDLSEYNTRKVRDMRHMFDSCMNLEILNLDLFNLENTKHTDAMLMNCVSLYEIRLDNCKYETIKKVIESKFFPTNEIIELPVFNTIEFDEETGNFNMPSYMLDEVNDENNTIYLFEDYIDYLKLLGFINRVEIFYKPGCFIRRSIFCRPENRRDLVAPQGWRFINVY